MKAKPWKRAPSWWLLRIECGVNRRFRVRGCHRFVVEDMSIQAVCALNAKLTSTHDSVSTCFLGLAGLVFGPTVTGRTERRV